jgi:hypothetical protein
LALAALSIAALGTARAQDLYITDQYGGSVSEYSLSGNPEATPLLNVSGDPYGIAIAGDIGFIADAAGNAINEYNLATGLPMGTVPYITQGLNDPADILLEGTDLFVANNGNATVTEYNILTGGEIGGLITGTPFTGSGLNQPQFLAISGNNLVVSSWNSVQVFDATTGSLLSTITGMSNARGVAVNGNILYVADSATGEIETFSLTGGGGQTAGVLVSGLTDPRKLIYYNGDLYVSDVGTNTVDEYNATTGAPVETNAAILSTANPYDFTIGPCITGVGPSIPEPSTWALLIGGLVMLFYFRRIRSLQL